MGYESRVYVISKNKRSDYGEKIAVFNCSKMGDNGWRNLFTKPIDFTSYHEDGDTPIAEDDYGEICKYTDLKTVIQWLEDHTNGYRRAETLLDLLKSFDNEKWINNDWEILILHYGY